MSADDRGLHRIKNTMPHRSPILLVDRVAEVVPGERLTAVKAVSANEPCYARIGQDAGPEAYAYPAALTLESWAQAAVLLSVWEDPNPDVLAGKVELAGSINGVEFTGHVYPGELVRHEVRLVKLAGDTAILAGESFADGRPLLSVASLVVALRDVTELRPQPEAVAA
ncbi:3-hydroxyacyl-ACP dehydratase FabZ family protein [Streptomyces sp. NPDC006487]|uniref:3-hydroxyacyl-ACP dehydratase FabZ family protein n=1 Tax=Streptomyces sp. NPDC006487 TaxID=3364748 RepID=UPI0036A4735E